LDSWVTYVRHGGTVEGVQSGLVSSPEYSHVRNAASDHDWLSALYQDALGRPADKEGLEAWSLRLPKLGRLGVASLIFNSTEYRRNYVVNAYQTYLHRPGSVSEVSNWVANFQTDEQVLRGFLAADEYFTRP
jgi:hypothetical protein